MPRLVKLARATLRRGATWRRCQVCDRLAAMPPGVQVCGPCSPVVPERGRS